MAASPPRRRRARPVADAPTKALLERADDLAKGWLLELIEQLPLDAVPSILAAELASEAPAICAAATRAVAADEELARIAAGGELEGLIARAGELAGARTAEAVSRAVDALRAVLWSALLGALADPDGGLLAALSERLALITELVRGAALRRLAEPSLSGGEGGRDWPRALEREVVRSRREGSALSLLLVELEEAGRILAVEPAHAAAAALQRFEAAVHDAVTREILFTGEEAGRAWVIAPGAGREGALKLGSVLADAVASAGSWRGTPLRPSIGVAVLGEDGADASALIEAAEESRFAASARGITVARLGPESESPLS